MDTKVTQTCRAHAHTRMHTHISFSHVVVKTKKFFGGWNITKCTSIIAFYKKRKQLQKKKSHLQKLVGNQWCSVFTKLMSCITTDIISKHKPATNRQR